jgi:nitroreductase
MSKIHHDVLASAAQDALHAPSVLNTQPWRWQIDSEVLELHADRDRQLSVADPDGRLLLVSCGAALHHARLAVAVAGWSAQVRRLADTFTDDLLARLTIGAPRQPGADERAMYEAIARRRTDRRPFGNEPVPPEAMQKLVAAAEAEHTNLHRVPIGQMPMLAIAAAAAGAAEMSDSQYRGELMRWANRPSWSGDGVPADTTVRRVPRRVPVRELTLPPQEGMQIQPGGDRGAAYFVLYGDSDDASDWLRAGEALSAVLLTAVALGLSVAPMSDVIEVAHPRELVRGLLAGRGYPYMVVRCGQGASTDDLATAPRRDPGEVIRE